MQSASKKRKTFGRSERVMARHGISRNSRCRKRESKKAMTADAAVPLHGIASMPALERQQENSTRDKPSTEKQQKHYAAFLAEMFNVGTAGYLKQYEDHLKAYVPPDLTREAFDQNMDKNRYKDVVCADVSRVILKGGENNYIHANFITHPALKNKFICTQGPMGNTVADFWRMVLQENVGVIVMLCETVEQGKDKCQQYWPPNAGDKIHMSGIGIENLKIENHQTVQVSVLRVTKGQDVRIVRHHHWRNWPDRGVPQSTQTAFRILKEARNCVTVVHCSAGIGRTGTVVCLEVCLQKLLACEKLCITSIIRELRSQRSHLVQTDLQLLFICKSLTFFSRAIKDYNTPDLKAAQGKFTSDYDAIIEARTRPAEKEVQYAPLVPIHGFSKPETPAKAVTPPTAMPTPASKDTTPKSANLGSSQAIL